MKSILTILLATLLNVFVASHASAWEFSLKGNWIWGYDYVDQAGGAGFFGPHDQSTAGLSVNGNPKVNSMNAWVGARSINGVQYGMVTGADASLQWSRMELRAEIRVNQAIRFKGAYQIGTTGVTQYGLYTNSTEPGGWNPFATGQWTMLWMEALTPWGALIAGKRDIGWGMGLQYEAEHDTTESLCVVAPYGPLKIGMFCYPWRGQAWLNPQAGRDGLAAQSEREILYEAVPDLRETAVHPRPHQTARADQCRPEPSVPLEASREFEILGDLSAHGRMTPDGVVSRALDQKVLPVEERFVGLGRIVDVVERARSERDGPKDRR